MYIRVAVGDVIVATVSSITSGFHVSIICSAVVSDPESIIVSVAAR